MISTDALILTDIFLKLGLALLPIPLIYLLYYRYFVFKPRYLEHLESFLYGIALAVVIHIVLSLLLGMVPLKNPLAVAFLKAALVEKLGAYLLVYFLLRRQGSLIIVLEAVILSMLLGIGFSVVENIVYAGGATTSLLLARLISAVPLHAYTCGMIGYFMGLSFACNSRLVRYSLRVQALLIPYLLHGLFDTFLLGGGGVFWIGPMLVLIVIVLEYLLARAQTLPPLELLEAMEIHFEDWLMIQREPQYERWILRSMGTKNEAYVPFFKVRFRSLRSPAAILLILIAGLHLAFTGETATLLGIKLKPVEQITLFSIIPGVYSLNLILSGAINPMYFRNSLLRIPIIADVEYRVAGEEGRAITYDIFSSVSLFKTVDEIPVGSDILFHFECPGFTSPPLQGIVIWDNHVNPRQPTGTVVRIIDQPTGFAGFMLRYYVFKFSRGITFFLRLPGFEGIRRFFLSPLSVMQQERRYQSGDIIFNEGEPGRDFYLIRKGEVEIFKTPAGGEHMIMALLGEGDIFGEMSIVGNQPRAASARCRTDCLLAVAAGDNLEALTRGNPKFSLKLIETFARRLHSSEKIMTANMGELEKMFSSRERIYFTALTLLVVGLGHPPRQGIIPLHVDFDAIAEFSGMPQEAIREMFAFLMRYENVQKLRSEILQGYIDEKSTEIFEKYLLVIEEE